MSGDALADKLPTGRIPPNDLGAERALLGCCVLEAECWAVVSPMLKATDFYADRNAKIWEAMRALVAKGSAIDTDLLRGQLNDDKALQRAGGDEYLLSLTDTIPTTANAEHLAQRILDLSMQRQVIHVAYQIAAEGYSGIENARDYVERAARAFGTISDRASGQLQGVSLADAVSEEYPLLEKRHAAGETILGHRSGFDKLDEMLSGWVPGDLIFVGARPGMGKTAFANGLKLGIARETGLQVLGIELEMTRQQLVHRLWAAEAAINMRFVRSAYLNADQFRKIGEASEELSRLPIELLFKRGLRLSELLSYARRRRRTHGPIGAIVIDYLQCIRVDVGARGRDETRDQQIGMVTSELKTLAGELNCPIIALSSLNRGVEQRPDKRPQLSDLRESGAIESDADTVLFLYRDEVYNPSKDENKNNPGITEVIAAKQRSGEMCTVKLRFAKEFTRFDQLEAAHNEHQQRLGYA